MERSRLLLISRPRESRRECLASRYPLTSVVVPTLTWTVFDFWYVFLPRVYDDRLQWSTLSNFRVSSARPYILCWRQPTPYGLRTVRQHCCCHGGGGPLMFFRRSVGVRLPCFVTETLPPDLGNLSHVTSAHLEVAAHAWQDARGVLGRGDVTPVMSGRVCLRSPVPTVPQQPPPPVTWTCSWSAARRHI